MIIVILFYVSDHHCHCYDNDDVGFLVTNEECIGIDVGMHTYALRSVTFQSSSCKYFNPKPFLGVVPGMMLQKPRIIVIVSSPFRQRKGKFNDMLSVLKE